MSTPDSHQDWKDTVGAYLLEALSDDERTAFEAHLEGCAACTREVELLRMASDALPASVAQFDPPAALKGRIMAVVQAEAELLAAAAGPRADLPERAPRRGWLGRLSLRPGYAAAAVGMLLLVGGVTGAVLESGGGDAPGRTVQARVERSGATAQLVLHDTDSKLQVAGLEAPPRGYVYQVWLKRRGGQPRPTAALFTPRKDGTGSVAVPGSLEGVDQVLVTAEPAGGSQHPTRQPVIIARAS